MEVLPFQTGNSQQSIHNNSLPTTTHQIISSYNDFLSWCELSALEFVFHNVQVYQRKRVHPSVQTYQAANLCVDLLHKN